MVEYNKKYITNTNTGKKYKLCKLHVTHKIEYGFTLVQERYKKSDRVTVLDSGLNVVYQGNGETYNETLIWHKITGDTLEICTLRVYGKGTSEYYMIAININTLENFIIAVGDYSKTRR